MERNIGDKFDYFGYTLIVQKSESGSCSGCFFYQHRLPCYSKKIEDVKGSCVRSIRSDDNHVIFKELFM